MFAIALHRCVCVFFTNCKLAFPPIYIQHTQPVSVPLYYDEIYLVS